MKKRYENPSHLTCLKTSGWGLKKKKAVFFYQNCFPHDGSGKRDILRSTAGNLSMLQWFLPKKQSETVGRFCLHLYWGFKVSGNLVLVQNPRGKKWHQIKHIWITYSSCTEQTQLTSQWGKGEKNLQKIIFPLEEEIKLSLWLREEPCLLVYELMEWLSHEGWPTWAHGASKAVTHFQILGSGKDGNMMTLLCLAHPQVPNQLRFNSESEERS